MGANKEMTATTEFIKKHFNIAYTIYSICDQEGLSTDIARLMTYIHLKISFNNDNYDYFTQEHTADRNALEFMLDRGANNDILKQDPSLKKVADVPSRIKALDADICDVFGVEFRVQSELLNRLRMYTDPKFRTAMIELYQKKIRSSLHKNAL